MRICARFSQNKHISLNNRSHGGIRNITDSASTEVFGPQSYRTHLAVLAQSKHILTTKKILKKELDFLCLSLKFSIQHMFKKAIKKLYLTITARINDLIEHNGW